MRLFLLTLLFSAAVVGSVAVNARRTPGDAAAVNRKTHSDGSFTVELLSSCYRLDRVYQSMTGPRSNQSGIQLSDRAGDDETIWITGLQTDVLDADDMSELPNEFVCHTNLTFNPETTTPDKHNGSFEPARHSDWRLFTLVPGRTWVHLPEGFGIPVKNATRFDYFTMALNLNSRPERNIRMRTRISCRRQPGGSSLKPLFRRSLYVYQQHEEMPGDSQPSEVAVKDEHQGKHCALSCSRNQVGESPSVFVAADDSLERHPGATCCVANASQDGIVRQFGRENTIHWMVPPGKHVYRSEVTEQMNLPFDTTVHYVTGHLHPFGKSIRLVDIERGKTIFHITSRDFADRLGVAEMSETVNQAGIPLKQGRSYELIAEYQNTSDRPIDAMAILYFYALDQ